MNRLGRYEFMKGDKDLLEGKVLGYVEVEPQIFGFQYPGMYASDSIKDLQPYIKLCRKPVSFYIIGCEGSTFFSTTCFLDSLEAIADVSGDVLYVGKDKDAYNAAQSVVQGINIYVQEYLRQIETSENARDFHGGKFIRMFWNYISELRNSIIRRDNKEKERSIVKVKRFMRDSAFIDNLPYLVHYLERNPDNVGALDIFIGVAQAFHDSNVLNIEQMWKKLKRLLDSSTTIHL